MHSKARVTKRKKIFQNAYGKLFLLRLIIHLHKRGEPNQPQKASLMKPRRFNIIIMYQCTVSFGCRNKLPQFRWLKMTEIYSFAVLVVRSSTRCCRVTGFFQFIVAQASLGFSVSLVTLPPPLCLSLWISFIRTLVIRFGTLIDNPGWSSHLKL